MPKLTLLDLREAKEELQGKEALRIKAGIQAQATRIYPSMTLADPSEFTEMFMGLKTSSGQIITREKAMRCSAMLAIIRILTEDLATIPHLLKVRSPKGASEAVDDPRYRMLKSAPNPIQTAFEVKEHMVLDMLLTGKFFNYIPRDSAGKITGIYPIEAATMSYRGQQLNGELVWDSADPNYPAKPQFVQSELWRGTMLNANFVEGRSLALLAREAIGLALAAQEQGARLFSNGVQTDLAISVPEALSVDERKEINNGIRNKYAGAHNAWMPLILEGGMTAERIGLTAQESQYLEARNYQLADLARVARIPGVLIGITDKTATFASAEQFFLSYARNTLMPWTVRIDQTADRDVISPTETRLFTQHRLSDLLKADQSTRFASYATAITGGFMQPAEARSAEDWNEIDGLDVTWIPTAYSVFGENPAPAPAPNGSDTDPAKGQPAPENAGNTEKTGKTGRLAALVATSILRSEAREFARIGRKTAISEAQAAGFGAWHVDKIMELTGASTAAALDYSEWRFANREADEEARARLETLARGN